ncbi:DUF2177 family protein [Methylocapsa palsarum]|uniref:Uncharacterized membrane protein n=1 Tax=Methylocapsa palsarum TaxID=1612308 RepID=A0A1I4BCY5_9HYPH|nr:DUF2177 family protein [Methylocapsa palsarum]SFK66645.1 Uncharacterized membrane protein [Methylocapsa palsarum]
MARILIGYIATAAAFFVLDFIWLSIAAPRLYRPMLGELLAPEPKLAVAAVFYLVYVAGVVVLVLIPALSSGSWATALGLGALLGLVAYGTYDFTNLATLTNWPALISVIDLAWGVCATAVAATAGFLVASRF